MLERMHTALLDAYPRRESLERLVLFRLECSLDDITRPGDLRDVAFQLLQWAESQGRLLELLNNAADMNRGNKALAEAMKDFRQVLPIANAVNSQLPPPTPVAPPAAREPLENLQGTMQAGSRFYIERTADEITRETISGMGATITIKGPRQVGKSSLLTRTIQTARQQGKHVVVLDFSLFEEADLSEADRFFRRFCDWLTEELELELRIDDYWKPSLGNLQRCTRYMSRYLLPELNGSLLLAMDEVERIFNAPFRSSFFSMLRNWHNSRSDVAWRSLDLALVTSTEPYRFIADLNQSPFNVGEVIELGDFNMPQVQELNRRYQEPIAADALFRLTQLIGGQPYMTTRALYLVASGRITSDNLFQSASRDDGPFAEHLKSMRRGLSDHPEQLRALRDVMQTGKQDDEEMYFRLRGAGLIRRDEKQVVMRCPLYTEYFGRHYGI